MILRRIEFRDDDFSGGWAGPFTASCPDKLRYIRQWLAGHHAPAWPENVDLAKKQCRYFFTETGWKQCGSKAWDVMRKKCPQCVRLITIDDADAKNYQVKILDNSQAVVVWSRKRKNPPYETL